MQPACNVHVDYMLQDQDQDQDLSSSSARAHVAPSTAAPEPSTAVQPTALSSSSLSSASPAASGTITAYAQIVELYENNIGLVTTITAEAIREALGRYPPEWLRIGIEIAVKREKRDWRYIEGILRNWQTEGFGGNGNGNGKHSSSNHNGNGKQPKDPNRYAARGYDFSDDVVLVDGEPYSPSQ